MARSSRSLNAGARHVGHSTAAFTPTPPYVSSEKGVKRVLRSK
jgi:hypothetical protein